MTLIMERCMHLQKIGFSVIKRGFAEQLLKTTALSNLKFLVEPARHGICFQKFTSEAKVIAGAQKPIIENVLDNDEGHNWWTDLPDKKNQTAERKTSGPKNFIAGSAVLYDFKEKLFSSSNGDWTKEDWKHFETSVLSEKRSLSKVWEAVCMGLVYHKGFVESGVSLIEFINDQGRSPNIPTLTSFIAMCGKFGNSGYQEIIYKSYDELLKKSDVFDSLSCKNIIEGLCGTDRWREAIPYLDMIQFSGSPTSVSYGAIAQAAFKNNDIEKALEMMDCIGEKYLTPPITTYLAFIRACSSSDNALDMFFTYLRKYSWFPPTNVMKTLNDISESQPGGGKYQFSWTRRNLRGECKSCGTKAGPLDLTEDQFKELQKNFLQKAVIDKDVFLKTSPTEFQRFLEFIHKTGQCDVVLDSLNIALRKGAKLPSNKRSELLHNVVDYFWGMNKKVLLLGRKHMLTWANRDMRQVQQKAVCFFADNISQDDPFLLYAALYSGRDTVFVSNDEMRDHKHVLGPKLGALFKQWQRSRQIYFLGVNYRGNNPRFLMPKAYDTLAQPDPGGWHIPYENGELQQSFQHPNALLCVRKNSNNSSKSGYKS